MVDRRHKRGIIMSVHVQGTASANPLTEVTEPISPVSGTGLTAGSQATIVAGPYTNNSNVLLKIASVTFSNQVNCTVVAGNTFPLSVGPGNSVNLNMNTTATTGGAYSFDVTVTWTT